MRDANVRRIDVAIYVEVANVAVAFLADVIRQPADGEQIVRLIKREAIVGSQALPGENFVRRRLEPRVRDLEFRSHFPVNHCKFQGRITTAAAPQKSRNNRLI